MNQSKCQHCKQELDPKRDRYECDKKLFCTRTCVAAHLIAKSQVRKIQVPA